jgi:phosphomannomutase
MGDKTGHEGQLNKAVPLKFGTSGLRALVTEMTDLECSINTRGFVLFLEAIGDLAIGDLATGGSVCVGGDLRSSTPRIAAAVVRAVETAGYAADFCGMVPSPVLAHYAIESGRPSIMITGSHIPEDRNGIKFTKAAGEVLKSDEALILAKVKQAREEAYAEWRADGPFDEDGMFRESPALPSASDRAEPLYQKRYLEFFPGHPLDGQKIVFYQHSAVGRDLLPDIFEALGAEVIREARSDIFVPVDTEKVSADTRRLLVQFANTHKPFAVVSTDGDSDRPLLADGDGTFLPGDKLGALASLYLKPDFVAVPVSTNTAVVEALRARGTAVVQTRIGSPYVIKAMLDKRAENASWRLASWEANGGFLTGSDWKNEHGVLKSLPTRDALLPVLSALLLAGEEGLSLKEVISQKLPPRYTSAGVVDDKSAGCEAYTAAMGKALVAKLSPAEADIDEVLFGESGGLTAVRAGVEGEASPDVADRMKRIRKQLDSYLDGAGRSLTILSINFVDGIRIRFAGRQVIHLRPSGNAPEFRFYTESDSLDQAESLVADRVKILAPIIADMG